MGLEGGKRAFGKRGLERVLNLLIRDQKRRYRQPNGHVSLPKRLRALCRARSKEGYMAEVVEGPEPGGLMIAQNHCPILSAACSCQTICDVELRLFQQTLGDAVLVECCEHALTGGTRCTYRVSERAVAAMNK